MTPKPPSPQPEKWMVDAAKEAWLHVPQAQKEIGTPPYDRATDKLAAIIARHHQSAQSTRVRALEEALKPLAAIADEYHKEGLDECRPLWGDGLLEDAKKELFTGRGGKTLLTLQHAIDARAALTAAPVVL